MAHARDPQKQEQPNTYVVQDKQSGEEMERLIVQDKMVTNSMGGVLPEQPDPSLFRRVLDVGCGTGGWLIEMAQQYPAMSLFGVDISNRMIDYARARAESAGVADRVEFLVNDATLMLEFPADFFDLANLRFGVSFLRTWDWPKMLSELQRVTRVGGIVRVTDGMIGSQSMKPALTQLEEMLRCAFYRAGHLFTEGPTGLIDHLERLLIQHGCEHVQTKSYAVESHAGTEEGEAFFKDMSLAYRTVRPYIKKWGCISDDYDMLYQQALAEMAHSDFCARGTLLTAWGTKVAEQPGGYMLERARVE